MTGARWPSRLLPAIAILLALWSAIPFAMWWDDRDGAYFRGAWATWGWGSMLALLGLAMVMVLSRGRAGVWLLALWRRIMAIPERWFAITFAALFALLALLMTLLAFDGNPRNVDGFAQLFQARIFLAGRLWAEPAPELANFATLQMLLGPERWYAQYPFGQSLVLAGGLALGSWWLLNPVIGAAFAIATWRVARWCGGDTVGRLALILLCLSPFAVAVAGSEMSHLPAATLGMAAAAAAIGARERPVLAGVLAGLALGLMTAFRPLDAVAAAVPVAILLFVANPRRPASFAATFAAGLIGAIPTLGYNALTTGSATRFGYVELWGSEHSLGFHPVPWGVALTLTRAIARSGVDLHQLNLYLLDTTVPVLVLVAAGFVAGRRLLQPRDGVPFAAVLALVAVLFAYWHRDVFYGPRFLFSVVGWLIIIVARAFVLIRRADRLPAGEGRGTVAITAVSVALAFGLISVLPGRIRTYRDSTPLFAMHPDRDAARAGIRNAVVLIPDGWGSRLIARMWALGVPVRRSTRLYAAIDACTLERALGAAEGDSVARGRLLPVLDSLASLNRPGERLGLTEDPNLRLLPDERSPDPACRAELAFDMRGFYSYAPYLHYNTAALDGDIVWARDLARHNGPLMRRYAGRRFYRYQPGSPGGPPAFVPLDTAR